MRLLTFIAISTLAAGLLIFPRWAAGQSAASEKSLPDAPSRRETERDLSQYGYHSDTNYYGELPKTTREVWNLPFTLTHVGYLSAIVFNVEVSHAGIAHHKCAEKDGSVVARGDLYRESLIPFAALTGIDWLLARYRVRIGPYVAPAVAGGINIRRGGDWFVNGCW